MKIWYGEWKDVKVVDLNRILKHHGVRLVAKKSKEYGKNVSVTAHATGLVVKRVRRQAPPADTYPEGGATTVLTTSEQPPLSSEFGTGLP